MDSQCINPADSNGNPIPTPIGPSSWMCQQMQQNGFQSCQPCHAQYVNQIAVSIKTGDATDSFRGSGISTAIVNIDLGEGNDVISWSQIPSNSNNNFNNTAFFDLGTGADVLQVTLPVSQIWTWLGDDKDPDIVQVWYTSQTVQPNINGNVISPVGPWTSHDILTMFELRQQDIAFVNEKPQPQKLAGRHRY